MAPHKRGDRVTGPYWDPTRDRWRLRIVTRSPDGRSTRATFSDWPTEAAAIAAKVKLEAKLLATGRRTVWEAIDLYETRLTEKGNKPGPIADTLWRLRRFFPDRSMLLGALKTKEDGTKLYADLRAYRIPGTGKPYAPDSHRNFLIEARTFLRWCKDMKGWTTVNVLEGIEGIGRRTTGADKEQLRIDEARRWHGVALRWARRDREEGAVAALVALYLGLRATEITARVVRDLDDDGRLLWIPDSKTKAGKRALEVPDVLRSLLKRSARGKTSTMYLLGPGTKPRDRGYPRKWVQRICRAAGVPRVSAHAMRRLHSTLALMAGHTSHDVAAQLGHESFDDTTAKSYVARGTTEQVTLRLMGGLLHGPRRRPRATRNVGEGEEQAPKSASDEPKPVK